MEVSKMGLVSAFAVAVTLMMCMEEGVMAFKEVKVGGVQAWHLPLGNDSSSFYDHWASSKRFHVGDSLRFEYSNDSVLAVDKYGYYHCDTSKATSTFNDGNTIIKLEHPGLVYFISGTDDHCRVGQRIVIDVMSHPRHEVAEAPGAHGHQAAVSPAPSPSATKNSGSQLAPLVQVSSLFGLVVASSLLF